MEKQKEAAGGWVEHGRFGGQQNGMSLVCCRIAGGQQNNITLLQGHAGGTRVVWVSAEPRGFV